MKERAYSLGYYAVAFLDVLGQREKFRKLKMPSTPEDRADVAQVLQETAGFVVEMRESFRKQFESFEAGISKEKLHITVSVQPRFVGFSDSFVMSVPLRADHGDLAPIVTIFSTLWAASVSALTALASKHPFRGGIDVGLATEIGTGEIYGTALERAYLLECGRAAYPRIVIGSEMWKFLTLAVAEFEKQGSGTGGGANAVLQEMAKMVATDSDGEKILDYLGSFSAKMISQSEAGTIVKPAYDFVVAEERRLLSGGDSKLAPRYALLRRYFELHLSQWGLEPHI